MLKRLFIFILFTFILSTGCQEEPIKKINISMVSGSVGKELECLEKQIQVFEALNPTVHVILIESPEAQNKKYDQYVKWLKNRNPSIDVYVIDVVWTAEFSDAGWIIPLDSYIKRDGIKTEDFLDSTIKASKWKEKLIALPWFTDAGMLYYRKDLLDKYGFEPPKTWEELEIISKKIIASEKETHPSMVGFVFQGDKYEGLVANYLEYIWGNGADVMDDDADKVILDSPEAIEALRTFAEMISISAPGILAFQEEDARNYFQSGNSVFMRNWPYACSLLDSSNSSVRNIYSIAPLPVGKQDITPISVLGGWQLAISAYSHHPDEAFKLIAFLTSEEQQKFKALSAGQNPTRKSCYSNIEIISQNPSMKSLFNILSLAHPRPVHPKYREISEIIQKEVYLTLKGQENPKKATKKITDFINNVISKQEN